MQAIPKKQNVKPIPKVKVQFIQQHSAQNKPAEAHFEFKQQTHSDDDHDQIENVEYLDEEILNHVEEPAIMSVDFVDTFYPNAIYCLIDTYHKKYEFINDKHKVSSDAIWRQIAAEMNECYFDFDHKQVRQKYALMRQQYFAVRSLLDIDAFEYFDKLHEIYQDKYIQAIAVTNKALASKMPNNRSRDYADEFMFLTNEEHDIDQRLDLNKTVQHAEIKCKDELKEMQPNAVINEESGEKIGDIKDLIAKIQSYKKICKRNSQTQSLIDANTAQTQRQSVNVIKRRKVETPLFEIGTATQAQQPNTPNAASVKSHTANPIEFSLAEYNDAKERRHQEIVAIMKQSLVLQERSIEMNRLLMEQLINRL